MSDCTYITLHMHIHQWGFNWRNKKDTFLTGGWTNCSLILINTWHQRVSLWRFSRVHLNCRLRKCFYVHHLFQHWTVPANKEFPWVSSNLPSYLVLVKNKNELISSYLYDVISVYVRGHLFKLFCHSSTRIWLKVFFFLLFFLNFITIRHICDPIDLRRKDFHSPSVLKTGSTCTWAAWERWELSVPKLSLVWSCRTRESTRPNTWLA